MKEQIIALLNEMDNDLLVVIYNILIHLVGKD